MRISDWSSDVCSSDLHVEAGRQHAVDGAEYFAAGMGQDVGGAGAVELRPGLVESEPPVGQGGQQELFDRDAERAQPAIGHPRRPEERSVGKECVRTGRSRGSPNTQKKKNYVNT